MSRPRSFSLTELLALRDDRTVRDAAGLALVEGTRFVLRARERKGDLVALVVCRERLDSAAARRGARELADVVPTTVLSPEAFERLSRLGEPTGLAAVVRQRWRGLPERAGRRRHLWLAVQEIRALGNLGTLMRTAEAAGATGLIALGNAVDPYDPRAVRASMGSVFGLRLVRCDAGQLRRYARQAEVTIVGAAGEARLDYRRAPLQGSAVVMLGAERHGLSPTQRDLCDRLVRIPMAGPTDSLNVAMAGGLLLYESYRQRFPLGRSDACVE